MPTASLDVVKIAEPALKVAVAILVLPSKNSTPSPFGGMPFAKLTDAVKVTDFPKVDGFRLEVMAVVVCVGLTT